MNIDLSVRLGGSLSFRTPFVLASGVNDLSEHLLLEAERNLAGAVTTKSCNLLGREGYDNPTVAIDGKYVLNAIGLANPGAHNEAELISKARSRLTIPIIASIFGQDEKEFLEVAEIVCSSKPNALELDLSCPHAGNTSLFDELEEMKKILESVSNSFSIPVFAKLSPAIPMSRIKKIVKIIEESNTYGITAINTMPAMLIDIDAKAPVLANRVGGMSGYCLKPIALRVVYEVRKHTELPIIGTGGISTWRDCVEMLLAGADALGIGTATWKSFAVFKKFAKGICSYMKEHNLKSISEIRMDRKYFS